MLVRLIFAVIIVAICWYFLANYRLRSPEQRKKVHTQYLIIGLALILILLTLTGRANWIYAALGGLLVLAQRLIPLVLRFLPVMGMLGKNSFIPKGIPTIKTKYLRIEIDYLTGEINGRIIDGPHKGSLIKQLNQDQLQELLDYYRTNDQQSLKLLVSYLNYTQRGFTDSNQYRQTGTNSSGTGEMSTTEARQILGVDADATREQIISAHKKLIQKFHPDRGGNDYLATKINQAKEQLLGKGQKR